MSFLFFFFFKQKTAYEMRMSDWSSDGCPSDLFKDRDHAAPGANRFFERMGQFLSLIGLTALVIAGIGVSNGVSSYLALKRNGIATLKVLGATSADIERIYLLQTGAIAAVAIGTSEERRGWKGWCSKVES